MAANLRLVENSTWYQEQETALDPVSKQNPVGKQNPVSKQNIDELLLKPVSIFNEAEEATTSYKMLAMVISAHLVILAAILTSRPDVQVTDKVITPMTVSLVNTPSSDEPQLEPETLPQQPEVVEIPKKQEQKVKQTRQLSELPAKELATSKAVVNEPAELPVMAEAAASENPIKTEQPAHVAETLAKAEVEPVIEPPKFGAAYLNNPAPTYPPLSRRYGEQGRVLLKVLVAENGLAESVQLDSSSGYEKLDRAAIEAVKKWSFIPAKRSNQPISAYVLVPVKFSLSS